MERSIGLADGSRATVTTSDPVWRHPANPILTAREVNAVWREPQLRVVTVHNAGVVRTGNETRMLFRSHLRCGVSVIGSARSVNGVTDWLVDPWPVLVPQGRLEAGGVEDPRINPIDGTYAITYSGYDARVPDRVRTILATTSDFSTFTRHGPMLDRDMRNVVLFPERLGGRYVGLFRPNDQTPGDVGGVFTQIRIGYAEDFRSGAWEIDPGPLIRTGHGPSAFSSKIGPGAPPVRTPHGWLNLFHGVRGTMDGNPYVLGVALHDLDDPGVVSMSSVPVLFPSRADCRVGETDYVHVPQVVFSCGMTRSDDGTLLIYYGGNDTVMNVAASHEDVLAELCLRHGQDPLTGELRYDLTSGLPLPPSGERM